MPQITIYTKSYCPYCTRAKAKLQTEGWSFKEIELKDEMDFAKLKNETGHMTVPQIFVDDEFIGGCDDLFAKIADVREKMKGF